MPSRRLFVALDPDPQTRGCWEEARRDLAKRWPGVRWTPPEQLHLTVAFLGTVPEARLAAAGAVCGETARATRAFELCLGGWGAFPPRGPARIVWIGLRAGAEAVMDLQARLAEGLRAAGFFLEERPFSPHVTAGRARTGTRLDGLDGWPEPDWPPMTVRDLRLLQSDIRAEGAVHSVVEGFPLAG